MISPQLSVREFPMDEPASPATSNTRSWWAACVLIIPISVFVIIWIAAAGPIIGEQIWVFGIVFIIAIALALVVIPLAVDDDYREQLLDRLRFRGPPSETLPYHEVIHWDETTPTQVWPTIRTESGEIVSIPRDYDSMNPPLLTLSVIQRRLPELEATIEELNANLLMISTTYESPTRTQEQLLIERSVANKLLASLVLQRGNKTLAPSYYTRKRRQLLRTIARIDEKLDRHSDSL